MDILEKEGQTTGAAILQADRPGNQLDILGINIWTSQFKIFFENKNLSLNSPSWEKKEYEKRLPQ